MIPAADALRTMLEAVPVAGLSALRVRVPFRRPFATATGMWLHREAWIVLLEGVDGRVGLGEAVLEPDATEVEETILARAIRETAARAREGDLPEAEELELLGGPGRALRAALDAARLDLALAPDGAAVPVNGTIGFAAPREGAEAALQAIEAGFRTLKLKAGAERETDELVARVRAIRQAAGPSIHLRLDVNGAWDLPTAEERLDAVARFDIEYVEQPLAADDTAGAAQLRERAAVPIAADEAVDSARAARVLWRPARPTSWSSSPHGWGARSRLPRSRPPPRRTTSRSSSPRSSRRGSGWRRRAPPRRRCRPSSGAGSRCACPTAWRRQASSSTTSSGSR